jgi:hypothetical protein
MKKQLKTIIFIGILFLFLMGTSACHGLRKGRYDRCPTFQGARPLKSLTAHNNG